MKPMRSKKKKACFGVTNVLTFEYANETDILNYNLFTNLKRSFPEVSSQTEMISQPEKCSQKQSTLSPQIIIKDSNVSRDEVEVFESESEVSDDDYTINNASSVVSPVKIKLPVKSKWSILNSLHPTKKYAKKQEFPRKGCGSMNFESCVSDSEASSHVSVWSGFSEGSDVHFCF